VIVALFPAVGAASMYSVLALVTVEAPAKASVGAAMRTERWFVSAPVGHVRVAARLKYTSLCSVDAVMPVSAGAVTVRSERAPDDAATGVMVRTPTSDAGPLFGSAIVSEGG